MTGGIGRLLALALACAVAGAATAGPRLVDRAAARQAIETPAVQARDAALEALASGRRTDELAARLAVIAHDATLDDVARAWLLDRGLHRLARQAPTSAAQQAVAGLAAREPVVWVRIDGGEGTRATPLYDTGATARFVLDRWQRLAARAAAAGELAAGRTQAIGRYAALAGAPASTPVPAGIADAFRAAPRPQLAAQRAAIESALAGGEAVGALALVLAERLADAEMFRLVFERADAATALAAVPAAARTLDVGAAVAVLARASHREDAGSAALLALGPLAREEPAARQALFTALDDPRRAPSAAAALAGLGDPDVSAEIGRRLAAARDEDGRRVLVLALRLADDSAARDALVRFARSGAGSPELRREVRAWLAR